MQLKCSQTQKHSKNIIKTVNVTSVAQAWFYEALRILFVCKENKNNDFIQQLFSSSSHLPQRAAIVESNRRRIVE